MIAKALLRWDSKLNQKENKQLGEKADRFYSSLGLAKVVTVRSLVVADADRYVPSGFRRLKEMNRYERRLCLPGILHYSWLFLVLAPVCFSILRRLISRTCASVIKSRAS